MCMYSRAIMCRSNYAVTAGDPKGLCCQRLMGREVSPRRKLNIARIPGITRRGSGEDSMVG